MSKKTQSDFPYQMTPEAMMQTMNDMKDMMERMAQLSPAGRYSPLMAHPNAAMAAATAMSMGAVSQTMGWMLGSMQGAMEASRRMGVPVGGYDMSASLRAFDTEWNKALGKAVVEAGEDAVQNARIAGEAVAAEVAEEVTSTPKKVAKANEAASGMAREVVDIATKQSAATAEKAVAAAEETAKAATKAAEPVTARKMAPAAKPAAPKPASSKAKAPEPKTPAMAKPKAMDKPAAPDDLKAISGVGPKLEEVLNKLGVWSYAQIAGWGPAEVAWIDDYLQFSGRIERDDWISQAKSLAK